MRIKQGERLYKFYYFRSMAGRHFEYRILTKEKINGTLEMVNHRKALSQEFPKFQSHRKKLILTIKPL